MKKYKLQELIAEGRLDISKLDADSRDQINDIKILTDNWTLENDTARESDDLLVQFLEIDGKITKKDTPPSPPPAPKLKVTKQPKSKFKVDQTVFSFWDKNGVSASKIESSSHPIKKQGVILKVEWDEKRNNYTYNVDYNKGFYLAEEDNLTLVDVKKTTVKFETKVVKLTSNSADEIIDDMVGKAFYFRGDKDHWIQAKLHNGYFANKKDKDKFRLEFYPIGGKEKFGMPLVSDIISLSDLEKLVAGEELAKYSLKKPSSLITDFDKAILEIDLCREEAKAEKAAQAKDKIPEAPKTSKEIFEEKSISWGKNMIKLNKIQNSDNDDKRKKIDKIIERASNEISEVLFGSKAAGEQIISALKSALD
jgi:hypothetical protein